MVGRQTHSFPPFLPLRKKDDGGRKRGEGGAREFARSRGDEALSPRAAPLAGSLGTRVAGLQGGQRGRSHTPPLSKRRQALMQRIHGQGRAQAKTNKRGSTSGKGLERRGCLRGAIFRFLIACLLQCAKISCHLPERLMKRRRILNEF